MFKKLFVFGILALSLIVIMGCTNVTNIVKDNETTGNSVVNNNTIVQNTTIINNTVIENRTIIENNQLANPASQFCTANGGKLEIRKSADGSETGYCTIKGQECEEWALYRGECSVVHFCSEIEKAAEVCTEQYVPVCGSNGRTYGNSCRACSAKVTFWTLGECGACTGTCPQFTPPGPDFCKGGEIVSGGVDNCGCNLPPICEP